MLALTTSLLAFQLPSAPIASRACAPSMCDAAATKTVPVTVGDTKVKFTNALGAALGVNPQFCQIPQNMQSFANELIMSETLAMASPRYTYTRVFALGFETLCDTFLSDGRSEKTAAATRSAMCVAFGLDQAQLEADASALRALSEGKSEEEVLAIDDLKELAAQKPTYSYIMGAGLVCMPRLDPSTSPPTHTEGPPSTACGGVSPRLAVSATAHPVTTTAHPITTAAHPVSTTAHRLSAATAPSTDHPDEELEHGEGRLGGHRQVGRHPRPRV